MDRQKENVIVVTFITVIVIVVFLLAKSLLDDAKAYVEQTQARYDQMYEELLDESLPAGSGK